MQRNHWHSLLIYVYYPATAVCQHMITAKWAEHLTSSQSCQTDFGLPTDAPHDIHCSQTEHASYTAMSKPDNVTPETCKDG